MKNKPLWRLSVSTTPEAEDAVMALLQTLFSQNASSYTDGISGEVIASVFLLNSPRHFRPALLEGLRRLRQFGICTGTAEVTVRKIHPQNWAHSWKRHFRPIEIGGALLIKPGWSKRRAREGQAEVVLDPGLGFGTGQHPTTAFCLHQLVIRRAPGRRQAFLDIGTGSGILAIAAAKLGYAPVGAFDSDREAVRLARANARRNRVFGKMHIYLADLTEETRRSARKYDLVCANLTSNVLLCGQRQILTRLKSDGILVLAGILQDEFPGVARAYCGAGLKLLAVRTDKEWRSGAFLRVKSGSQTLSHMQQSLGTR